MQNIRKAKMPGSISAQTRKLPLHALTVKLPDKAGFDARSKKEQAPSKRPAVRLFSKHLPKSRLQRIFLVTLFCHALPSTAAALPRSAKTFEKLHQI